MYGKSTDIGRTRQIQIQILLDSAPCNLLFLGPVIYGDDPMLLVGIKVNGVQAGEMAGWEKHLLPTLTT